MRSLRKLEGRKAEETSLLEEVQQIREVEETLKLEEEKKVDDDDLESIIFASEGERVMEAHQNSALELMVVHQDVSIVDIGKSIEIQLG